MKQNKQITILGSTGSIGVQSLQVLDSLNEMYSLGYITAFSNIDLLEKQVNTYKPKGVVICNELAYKEFIQHTSFKGKILFGTEGLIEAVSDDDNTLILNSLVGFSGVIPTYNAIKAGKSIALANKETLVSAGKIITDLALEKNVNIIPVDSEHNAILQCIVGEVFDSIEKIILTASGGPFFKTEMEDFENITLEQALNHPNWSMGDKITIDSATMMNKGFEVIEAYWLFNLPLEKIQVMIHPQSIVHSLVQFKDGSIKAQLGLPDMQVPIAYALTYPNRMNLDLPRLDLTEISGLEFFKPNPIKFKCLQLANDALLSGGNIPAVLNAANEVAVAKFLNKKIAFNSIHIYIEKAMESITKIDNPSFDEIIETDLETRNFTEKIIDSNNL